MRSSEIEAMGEVAGEALAAGGRLIKEMHEGIASRSFNALGTAGAPVRTIHDGIANRVYAGVGTGLRQAARRSADAAAKRAHPDGPQLASRPVASLVLGALNGFYGDQLIRRESELSLDMEIRHQGERIQPGRPFPEGTPRMAVFVHGLCETEAAWELAARAAPTYGDRLQRELGITPVYVRYNTGLHVSDNGRRLARLLDELVGSWPTSVEEIILIGHSMGGLVARSACHYAEKDGLPHTDKIKHVFCLGTPHLGADLEKGANALAYAFAKLPETKPFATLLNSRSVGIKDLRYGSCVEEDWCDCEPDEFLRDRCQEVPFLPDANYYFIGAALRPTALGTVIGDLLVRMPSASGRGNGKGRRIPFEIDNGHEISGLNHFQLLGHPSVYEQLHKWITR